MNLSPHKQDKISKRLFLENLFVLLKVIFLKIKHRPPFSPQVPPPPPSSAHLFAAYSRAHRTLKKILARTIIGTIIYIYIEIEQKGKKFKNTHDNAYYKSKSRKF